MTDFERDCEDMVRGYAEEINQLEDDYEALSNYLGENVYDVEYRIGSDKELRSVCLMIAGGGPNIYIDTEDSYVKLYWGSTRTQAPISYSVSEDIDEYYSELLSCIL